jgi:hypothetical protein
VGQHAGMMGQHKKRMVGQHGKNLQQIEYFFRQSQIPPLIRVGKMISTKPEFHQFAGIEPFGYQKPVR